MSEGHYILAWAVPRLNKQAEKLKKFCKEFDELKRIYEARWRAHEIESRKE